MPLYSDLGLYGTPSSSYSSLYLSSPYANHSSILAANYRSPVLPKTLPRSFARGYKPHLATITESQTISPLRRKFSPTLLLQHHSSPKYKVQKPININTADIDVSVNKYRKYDRKAAEIKKSPEKSKSPSPSSSSATEKSDEDKQSSSDEKPAIRRDRALVRLHTVHKKDSPRKNLQNGDMPKSWRQNFYADEPKAEEKRSPRRTPGELLVDKFLIRTKDEEERLRSEGRKLPRKESVVRKTKPKESNFHKICRAISSETINENLNPGQPDDIVRMQSKQIDDDLLNKIRRNSSEILKDNVTILEDLIKQELSMEGDENNNEKRKKKVTKKKSNEKLVLDHEPKSTLHRRPTQKKIRRTSTDSSFHSDIDDETEKAYQEAIRDISQVEVEEIKLNPKPKITATVDVDETPILKAVIEDVEIVESPSFNKPKKFKFNVSVEEVENKNNSLDTDDVMDLPETKLNVKNSAMALKREKSKSPTRDDAAAALNNFPGQVNKIFEDKKIQNVQTEPPKTPPKKWEPISPKEVESPKTPMIMDVAKPLTPKIQENIKPKTAEVLEKSKPKDIKAPDSPKTILTETASTPKLQGIKIDSLKTPLVLKISGVVLENNTEEVERKDPEITNIPQPPKLPATPQTPKLPETSKKPLETLKTSQTPATPKFPETSKKPLIPKPPEPLKTPETPQTSATPKLPETPKKPLTPKLTETLNNQGPKTLETPQTPSTPKLPETPKKPLTPKLPDTSNIQAPKIPETTKKPLIPKLPETPNNQVPKTPETPQTPSTPKLPDTPKKPLIPKLPETPNNQVPKTPETPQTPSTPKLDKKPLDSKVPETPKTPTTPKDIKKSPEMSPKSPDSPKSPTSPKVGVRKIVPKLAPKEDNNSGENFWEKIGTRESVYLDLRRRKLQEKRYAALIQEEDEVESEKSKVNDEDNKANKSALESKLMNKVEKDNKFGVEEKTSKKNATEEKLSVAAKDVNNGNLEEKKNPGLSAESTKFEGKEDTPKSPIENIKPQVGEKKTVMPKSPFENSKPQGKDDTPKSPLGEIKVQEKKILAENKLLEKDKNTVNTLYGENKLEGKVEIKAKIPKSSLGDGKHENKIVAENTLLENDKNTKTEKTGKTPETPKPDLGGIKLQAKEEKKTETPKSGRGEMDENKTPVFPNGENKLQGKDEKKTEIKLVTDEKKPETIKSPIGLKDEKHTETLGVSKPQGKYGKKTEITKVGKDAENPGVIKSQGKDLKKTESLEEKSVEDELQNNPPRGKDEKKVIGSKPTIVEQSKDDKKEKVEKKIVPIGKKVFAPEGKYKEVTETKIENEVANSGKKVVKPKLKKEKSEETKVEVARMKVTDVTTPAQNAEVVEDQVKLAEEEKKKLEDEETKKKIISKRSLVNKSGIEDPDLKVFVVPEEPPPPPPVQKEPSPPKFVPLQSNRITQWMHPFKKPEQFDECPIQRYARPKTIRHRYYPRSRAPVVAEDGSSDEEEDDDDEEEEDEGEEEETSEESGSEDSDESEESEESVDYEALNDVWGYGKVGASTSSDDSGFDSSTLDNRKNKGCSERDSPTSNPAHNPAFALDPAELSEEFSQSSTFAGFQKSGRITPPATTIPRFRKYNIEDFNFLKVLGKGSFGKVLLAELKDTEYYYAIKCLKKDVVLEDDDVECTLIERKVLALGTKHPYLCHLLCTFQTESHLFFVMEYLNGGDLMFHIQKSGRFPEPRARFYAAEIVSGLKFLHSKGIVYRDLKLDNILLDFDGHVRIADFGMCKLQIFLDRTADTFCGTPDYMAPEIIKGQHYNQNVDWWSFGVLLYEMLIGQSPFSGCDEDELFWSICNEIPRLPKFLSKEASSILTLLLEKDATKRLGNKFCHQGDIMEQPFFHPVDWEMLNLRKMEPPFKPCLQHPLDTQYFDRTFTVEKAKLTPIQHDILQSMDQAQFQGFSYTNPNATDR